MSTRQNLIIILSILTISNSLVFSQQWTFVEDFVTTSDKLWSMPHGIVVTPDNKIWIGFHRPSEILNPATNDSISPIWIYNPDKTLHYKIRFLTYNNKIDTLSGWCRGVSLDNNGNVLYSEHDKLWRINYKTYQAMNKIIPVPGKTITEAACDTNGYIYLTHVKPDGAPIYIYDNNFKFYNVVDFSVNTLQRSIVVSPNGKDVYLGRIGSAEGNGIIHYHCETGPSGKYVAVDTLHNNIWGECLDWDKNGLLWVGSYWNVAYNELNGWYALDPKKNWDIVSTVGRNYGIYNDQVKIPPSGTFYSPRGAAWSADGTVMYTADFDGHVIKKWYNPHPVGVDFKNSEEKPSCYRLEQNYPNPFNPSTTIEFSIPYSTQVVLKIYDVLGKEVATLIDEVLPLGQHQVNWNAQHLASGVYIYKIQTGEFVQTKKMIVMR